LDAFEAILDPEQNISAEGLDEEENEDDEEEDSEDEYESVDEDMEDEDEEMENEDDESELVTMAMVNEWSAAASKKSPVAWKKLLLAFRSIVRSDEESEKHFTYRVESSKGIFFTKNLIF
jgi:nucleolar complex protein 2